LTFQSTLQLQTFFGFAAVIAQVALAASKDPGRNERHRRKECYERGFNRAGWRYGRLRGFPSNRLLHQQLLTRIGDFGSERYGYVVPVTLNSLVRYYVTGLVVCIGACLDVRRGTTR